MDYNKIIVDGLLNANAKKHLDLYFYREYQNAKEKHYTLTEFFDGLIHAIEQMQSTAENKRLQALKKISNEIEFAEFDTVENANIAIEKVNAKIEFLTNSELTIDIENEEYKGEISFKILKHLIGIITLVFEKAKKNEGLSPEAHSPKQNFNNRIFTSEKGQTIFDKWHELHKDQESLADYSFIFRMLEKDGFLQYGIGETIFRNFIEDFNITLGKLKTFNNCKTTKRINLYNTIKMAIR